MNGEIKFKFSANLPIKTLSARLLCQLLLCTCLSGGFTSFVRAGVAPLLQLIAVAPVGADGVFLPQILSSTRPLPVIRAAFHA